MSAEQLSLIAGAILSLVFSYVPGVAPWFAGLRSEYKRLLMAGLLLLSAAVVMALSCSSWGADWGIELSLNARKGIFYTGRVQRAPTGARGRVGLDFPAKIIQNPAFIFTRSLTGMSLNPFHPG